MWLETTQICSFTWLHFCSQQIFILRTCSFVWDQFITDILGLNIRPTADLSHFLSVQSWLHYEHLWKLVLFSRAGGGDELSVLITRLTFHVLTSDGVLLWAGMHHGGIIALSLPWPVSWKGFRWFGISLPHQHPSSHGTERGGEYDGGWVFDLGQQNLEGGVCEHLHK